MINYQLTFIIKLLSYLFFGFMIQSPVYPLDKNNNPNFLLALLVYMASNKHYFNP